MTDCWKEVTSLFLLQERKALSDLMAEVDGDKFNCHASSILDKDTDDATQQLEKLSVKDRKVSQVEKLMHGLLFPLLVPVSAFYCICLSDQSDKKNSWSKGP